MSFNPYGIINKRFFPLFFFLLLMTGFSVITKIAQGTDNQIIIIQDTIKGKTSNTDSLYREYIKKAESFLAKKDFQNALSEYENAKRVKPKDQYSGLQISKVTSMLKTQALSDVEYQKRVASADMYFAEKDFLNAKAGYQFALDIKPDDLYAKGKLQECMERIRSMKASNILYDVALAGGDKFFKAKEYQKALEQYENASRILPNDKVAKEKINTVIKIMVDEQNREEVYANAITAGDNFYNAKKYANALTEYKNALIQKPAEAYPQQRITEINEILAKQKNADELYRNAILAADQYFKDKSYLKARPLYEEASTIKPDEEYPVQKISEIDRVLATIEKTKSEYDNYVNLADSFYINKKYINAKANYQLALNLKPGEAYPKEMINKADNLLVGLQANEAALEEAYRTAITSADKSLNEKDYTTARSSYETASGIKPTETYPKTKIIEIDLILASLEKQQVADQEALAARQKAAEEALALREKNKADSLENVKRSAEEAKLLASEALALRQKQVADSIDSAKRSADEAKRLASELLALRQKQVADSIDNAKRSAVEAKRITDEALTLRQKQVTDSIDNAKRSADEAKRITDEALALRQKQVADSLDNIKRIADENLALKKQAETAKKQIDDQYKSAIAKADQFYSSGSLIQAKEEYTIAVNLKSEEQYPASRIAAIDKVLSDRKAFDDKYNEAIASADKLFAEKSYSQAKTGYQEAARMKVAEKYPKDQIVLIDKTLADQVKEKSVDDKYIANISKADKLFNEKNYQLAKTEYGNAVVVKPLETYPKDKIAQIDILIAENKAKDDAYAASISKANSLLAQKSYEIARSEYQNAGELKPDEQFPKAKIIEINNLLTEIKGKKGTFDDLVAGGDDLFGKMNYKQAKESYRQALDIFPDEAYPKLRIAKIASITDSIYRANKAIYDKAVAEGDKAYNSLIYDKAIDSYSEASSYLPDENYPKDMINKIRKNISENAIVDVITTSTIIKGGAETKFPFPTVNIANRKNNYVYIKIRNLGDKTFNVLLRYGKDNLISGGAVIRNLAADDKINDRLISFRDQDPWYRVDNNYISLYPQGGDVEVTFIQISRAAQ